MGAAAPEHARAYLAANGLDATRSSDLLEIAGLVTEFAHRIDCGRSSEVADLFTETGWYGREGGEKSCGREELRVAYARRERDNPLRLCRHLFSNLRVEFTGEALASGLSTLTLFAGNGTPPLSAEIALVQDYIDEYRRIDGRWLFASRETRRLFVGSDFRDVLLLGAKT